MLELESAAGLFGWFLHLFLELHHRMETILCSVPETEFLKASVTVLWCLELWHSKHFEVVGNHLPQETFPGGGVKLPHVLQCHETIIFSVITDICQALNFTSILLWSKLTSSCNDSPDQDAVLIFIEFDIKLLHHTEFPNNDPQWEWLVTRGLRVQASHFTDRCRSDVGRPLTVTQPQVTNLRVSNFPTFEFSRLTLNCFPIFLNL